jgi:hypothetical protein
MLESIQATDPQQFASIPLYEVARVFKAQRDHRSWEDEEPTEAQKAVLRSKRIPYEGITKGQASELTNTIYNAATKGQVRRLAFYGIDFEGQRRRKRVSLSMTTSQVIRMQRTIIRDGR